MDSIFRGEPIYKEDFINKISELKEITASDLLLEPLKPEIVIEAVHTLANEINQEEIVLLLAMQGIPKWASKEFVKVTVESLNKDTLSRKIFIELGENPFVWKRVNDGIEEKEQPLGVIVHIGAGNTLGLSAFSVIEGLLSGNINILKLPENERGISARILIRLVEIEPLLKPYIYVLDVSSKNKQVINQLIQVANGVVVWGSDVAISGIRQLAPPSLPIIEWGQKLSFAYFTKQENDENDLQGLARDICLTDQLYCSSPQCVFYETSNPKELDDFTNRLARYLEAAVCEFPSNERSVDVQAQITLTHELIRMEAILKEKKLITDEQKQYSVMVDYHPELKPSPLYRNIWAMPIKREELFRMLRAHRGYLQTVGLSCNKEDLEELSKIFYAAGINRITPCGSMSNHYVGEAHDGSYPLRRYVRKVNRRSIEI